MVERQATIRRLVQDMLDSGRTAEDVCIDYPHLLDDVRRLWTRASAVEEQIEAMFPSSRVGHGYSAPTAPDAALPRIPGYEVHSVLGHGGMGVVYKARHISLNRSVAIKVPLAGAFATPSERQRNIREAQAVAKLGHPNIVTVHDIGEFDGRPYFTMELVDGTHLGAGLANTPQPAREAAALLATIADAVHCAHQAGIVHRDLKPANILLASDGTPKITDFGLARNGGGDATLTAIGFEFGTPSYMSPEQASAQPAAKNPGVDIYSLGAILYEMLTGRPPFRAETTVETLRQVLEEEPAPPSRLNARVPRDLETICLTCLHKDPRRRYSSARLLADDLRRFLKNEPVQARRVGPVEKVYRWGRRHPAQATLIGAGVWALVAAIVVGFWAHQIQNTRAAEATVREGRARQAIETALALTDDLRANERWAEARHVLDDAYSHLPEAKSTALLNTLARADQYLTIARELDDIRRRYPESNDRGYDYKPASEAYNRIFTQLGLGPDVSREDAAQVVNSSPIRKELLIALDNSAFVARVNNQRGRLDRWLAIARSADPDPWRDRFRQPEAWYQRDALLALNEDARSHLELPPPHQVVIVGVLLSGLRANDKAIEILREAHERNPVDFWINLELGNALARASRFADSCQYFRAAATIQPKNHSPWITLAQQLNRSGYQEEAIIAVRRATELNPRSPFAWRNYISYLRSAGRIDQADAVFRTAIEKTPDLRVDLKAQEFGIGLDRARLFASRGAWQQALNEYKALLPNGPDDAEFWFEVAAVHLIAGERDDYERIRDSMLEWNRPGVLRPFLVARATTLLPASLHLVETAATLSEPELLGEVSAFWALMQRGAILCRSGRPAEAIPLFESSIALAPTGERAIVNWLWLAIANHQLGHTEIAKRWYMTAVTWLNSLGGRMPDDALARGFHLHHWLEAQILLREAEARLSTDERCENR